MQPSTPATPVVRWSTRMVELIGINTFLISSTGAFAGAGFAIPTQTIHPVVDSLIKNGVVHHGYLGVGLNDVTPDNAKFFNLTGNTGALIASVTPNSPASRAGLKEGDVVTSCRRPTG